MICKRIRTNRRKRKILAQQMAAIQILTSYAVDLVTWTDAGRLTGYVRDVADGIATHAEVGEKVRHNGSRNFWSQDFRDQQTEMQALSMFARGHDALEHYVVSWPSDEAPDLSQSEHVLSLFTDLLGYQACPVIWSTHENTHNVHMHIVVLRVDVSTGKLVSPGDGWELDRIHQFIALAERAHGWRREKNAHYQVDAAGALIDAKGVVVRDCSGRELPRRKRKVTEPPQAKLVRFELRHARSWPELHRTLALHSAAYVRTRTGAQIVVGDVATPASHYGRDYSMARLTAKLGPYQDNIREPDLDPYSAYKHSLAEERERLARAREAALTRARKMHARARKKKLRAERDAFIRVISEERLKLRLSRLEQDIREAFSHAQHKLHADSLDRSRWLAAGQPDVANVDVPIIAFADWAADLPDVTHTMAREGVDYMVDTRLVISDRRDAILVHDHLSQNVIAALRIAAARWTGVEIDGPEDIRDICEKFARENDFIIILAGERVDQAEAVHDASLSTNAVSKTDGVERPAALKDHSADATHDEPIPDHVLDHYHALLQSKRGR